MSLGALSPRSATVWPGLVPPSSSHKQSPRPSWVKDAFRVTQQVRGASKLYLLLQEARLLASPQLSHASSVLPQQGHHCTPNPFYT